MNYIKGACLIIITIAVSFALIELGLFEIDSRRQLDLVSKQAEATLLDYARLSQDATGVTAEIRKTLKSIQVSSDQAARNSALATSQLNTDLVKFGLVLDNLNQDEKQLSAQTSVTLDNLNTTITSIQPAVKNINEASEGVDKTLNDPSLRQTLLNVQKSSDNIVGITSDVHEETGLLVDQTKKALQPQNKFMAIAKMALGGTLTVAELVYYLSK